MEGERSKAKNWELHLGGKVFSLLCLEKRDIGMSNIDNTSNQLIARWKSKELSVGNLWKRRGSFLEGRSAFDEPNQLSGQVILTLLLLLIQINCLFGAQVI